MNEKDLKLVLTGFMGVGKSSVARHLAVRQRTKWIDLDRAIEEHEKRNVADIIDSDGVDAYRDIESRNLQRVLDEDKARILSLGGGTWTVGSNRMLLKHYGFTSVWLDAPFEHSWLNITFSRKSRPLARDKKAARKLFDERQKVYCLADWHFAIRSDQTSHDVARQIADEIFS